MLFEFVLVVEMHSPILRMLLITEAAMFLLRPHSSGGIVYRNIMFEVLNP
jgi:hypothetical protein